MLFTAPGNPDCSLKVGLICNKGNTVLGNYTLVGGSVCQYETTYTGEAACPLFTISAIWEFLDQYKYYWGAGFILLGIFLGLLGRRLWVAAIFIIATFVVMGSILLLFYTTFLKTNTKEWVGWLMLALSLIIGLVVGFLMTKLQRVGAALLAAWGGFMAGLLLNETVLYLFKSNWVFWLVCVGCAVVAAALVFVAYNHVIILSTSLVGSYFFIRGISMYAGHFPNEYTLVKDIKSGVIEHEPW